MNSRKNNGKTVLAVLIVLAVCFALSACGQKRADQAIVPITGNEPDRSITAGPEETDATPTVTVTEEPSPSPTLSPTPTSSPTPTPEPTATPSPSPTSALAEMLNSIPDTEDMVGVLTVDNWSDAVEIPPITYDYVFSKVGDAVNVRSGPSTKYEIIGKFRLKSYGKIIERCEGWTKIRSGDVEGYVSNEYLYMDEEAIELAEKQEIFTVTIEAIEMNVRKEPNTNCEIVGKARNKEKYIWHPELSKSGWYAIQYTEDTIAYVSADYTKAASKFGLALTMAQEEARVKAEWYAKAMAYSKAHPPKTTNRAAINLTDEELYLLAVFVAMEALWEPYEGKLMVANVIINRILCGEWGHTLREVVYAKGQFTGANSGRDKQFWYQVNDDCKRAAVEAAAGYNNIGDYLFFIAIDCARFDLYYDYYVFHGHCFYKRHW